MKTADLRKLTSQNLVKKITEMEEKHFSFLCTSSIGTSSDTSLLKKNRKLIARAKTILNETLKQKGGK